MPENKPEKLKVLDLFSGILVGGFSLGLERTGGFETVAFCEIEPFCQKVLKKHWPDVEQHGDIRTVNGRSFKSIDVICGGFPCQDISTAGKKEGIDGVRSSLWREYARLIREIRPSYVIVENSAALLNRGLDAVLRDLAEGGYDAEWQCISASVIGAPHGRDRCWIVAYPNNKSQPGSTINDETCGLSEISQTNASNAKRRFKPLGRVMARIGRVWKSVTWDGLWDPKNSPIGMGVVDGVPRRMDRLRALGNAVVPQIPELIGYAILEAEKQRRSA